MLVPGPQVSPLPVVECPGELLQELIQGLQRPITPVIPALRKLWQEGCGKFQASPSYSVKRDQKKKLPGLALPLFGQSSAAQKPGGVAHSCSPSLGKQRQKAGVQGHPWL